MNADRLAVILLSLLIVAGGVLQSTNVIVSLVFCIVTAPFGRLLLRRLEHPWRVAMLGACVAPSAMVVHDLIAIALSMPIEASLSERSSGPPPVFSLFFLPLIAGLLGLCAVFLYASDEDEPGPGVYGFCMVLVLFFSVLLANNKITG